MVTPISWGAWPRPLEPAPRLAAALGLQELWIKRDDLVGLGGGGNKVGIAILDSGISLCVLGDGDAALEAHFAETPQAAVDMACAIGFPVSLQLLSSRADFDRVDAVRAFTVLRDNYSARYGQRSGAQVLIVTRSGSNQLHGSVYEFLRNNALDAPNYFDKGSAPPFQRNQFGASLGGPIQRNKTFLFANYEGFRQHLHQTGVDLVPDANARQGLLPCKLVSPTPSRSISSRLSPVATSYSARYGPPLNGFQYGGSVATTGFFSILVAARWASPNSCCSSFARAEASTPIRWA